MNIHEYQAKELLARFGVNIPRQKLCYTATEAEWAARGLNGETKPTVVKAQVHAGGRGKGGGVKFAKTPDDAREHAKKILGMTLVTPQTGPQGKFVRKVLVVDAGPSIEKEYYLALVVNRDKASIGFMLSPEGGMDIEEVAHKTPEKIFNENVDPTIGLQACHLRKMSSHFGFTGDLAKQFEKIVRGLYDCFLAYDCAMLEINPLAVTKDGDKLSVQVLDCKMSFDDNALFRHPELKDLRDFDEEDEKELEASRYGLNYIALEGNIGCLVNGAGLAMATMDIIKQYGGAPANFLDVGGGATQEMVTQAFRIILRDPNVKGIFVNIFGGIMKCDIIANGVVAAAKDLGLKVPLVVRLEGTNVEEGKKILNTSGLNILSADSMGDGAGKIVKAVQAK